MKKRLFLIYLISCFLIDNSYSIDGISILASRHLLENELVQKSVDDCLMLLQKACQCPVEINDRSQEVLLFLPDIDSSLSTKTPPSKNNYPSIAYPEHGYQWTSQRKGQQIHLKLETNSPVGISFGMYGLLQEQLWFAFYHPKQSIIPKLEFWPLTEEFSWKASPRFSKKGFHLHTMHPIELTEPLLNPACPNGIEQVKEYIDWLVRNQQNYFEFNLLECQDLNTWVSYIKPVVDYAHARGVLIGLDLSLHMTQQKAFMLYKNFPNSLKTAKKQIEENLAILFEAPWDVITLETSTTEFTQGNQSKIQDLQLYITDLVVHKYHAHLANRQHVVQDKHMLKKGKPIDSLTTTEQQLDANRALFVHTVMFYGLTDSKAPVYKNENLLHLLDLLQEEQKVRETWYYPESAYWVTFDNSVPMLLMPYLQTRLDDILLMDSLDVEGHLTFSSGWEWGYWLIDWSIARWSWKHQFNHKDLVPRATQFLTDIFHNQEIVNQLNALAHLQQKYIKEKELIRYMVAQTVTDEMPKPFNIEFHPRPEKSYKWMRYKANRDDILMLEQKAVQPLLEFATIGESLVQQLKLLSASTQQHKALLEELTTALSITNLRAKHKAQTLSLLLQKRKVQLTKDKTAHLEEYYKNAEKIRLQAQKLVKKQEQQYRYPLTSIARKMEQGGTTAYNFGYLYPVSNLHFWEREEEQVKQDKYGPFFMSIWDIPRILGIVD